MEVGLGKPGLCLSTTGLSNPGCPKTSLPSRFGGSFVTPTDGRSKPGRTKSGLPLMLGLPGAASVPSTESLSKSGRAKPGLPLMLGLLTDGASVPSTEGLSKSGLPSTLGLPTVGSTTSMEGLPNVGLSCSILPGLWKSGRPVSAVGRPKFSSFSLKSSRSNPGLNSPGVGLRKLGLVTPCCGLEKSGLPSLSLLSMLAAVGVTGNWPLKSGLPSLGKRCLSVKGRPNVGLPLPEGVDPNVGLPSVVVGSPLLDVGVAKLGLPGLLRP